jgi:Dolichyl-phosphate-mannose-protein mannosyltransferase
MAAGAVVLVAALFWITDLPNAALRFHLAHAQFWFLELQCLLLVGLGAVELKKFLNALAPSPAACLALIAAMACALFLAFDVAPRVNRIYYDEFIYQNIGENLAHNRVAEMCNDGVVEYGTLQCRLGEYNKEPNGYPYVLSVLYRLFGVRERTASDLNVASMAVFVFFCFALSKLLFGDERAAMFAALFAAFIPQHLRWANTAASEPLAALMTLVAVTCAVYFARVRTNGALALSAVALAAATQFRPESALVVVCVVAAFVLLMPQEIRRLRVGAAVMLACALGLVTFAHLYALQNDPWNGAGVRLSLSYLLPNLKTNAWLFVANREFPAGFTLLAGFGLLAPGRRAEKATLIAYFLAFFGVFLVFYAGSYRFGANVRYSILAGAPLVVFAGMGAAMAARAGARWCGDTKAAWLVAALVAIHFTWFLPLVRSVGEESWGSRTDVAFGHRIAQALPPNSIVLTHTPSMFQLWGANAAQASLATTDPSRVSGMFTSQFAGGVYFHWGFWCNVDDKVQHAFCQNILDRFPHEVVAEDAHATYRYVLYRLR